MLSSTEVRAGVLQHLARPRAVIFLLTVLLAFCGAAAATRAADAPAAGANTIVIKLPATMPLAEIDALMHALAGKGVTATRLPGAPRAAAAPVPPTSAELAARIWRDVAAALRSLPRLRQAPELWSMRLGRASDADAVSARFWLVAVAGLLSAPLSGLIIRGLLDRRVLALSRRGGSRPRIALLRLAATAASLPVFAGLFWIALTAVSSGDRFLGEAADRLVLAALEWRFAIATLVVVLSPGRADLRLLEIDDADAARCMCWLSVYATIAPLDYCLIWLIERVGFTHSVVFGTAFVLGAATTAYKIAMLWVIRRPIARAILAATREEPSPLRRGVAAVWHWFFILLALAIMAAAVVAFSLGEGAAVYGAATMTQIIVVVMAVLWLAGQKVIDQLFSGAAADAAFALRRRRFIQALRRLCDALALLLGIAWLAEDWGLDLVSPAPGSVARLLLRPALVAAATVLGAWMLWLILSGIIDEKMPRIEAPDDDGAPAAETASRLTTLLPLLRNLLLVGIGMLAVLAALSSLGVDLAPLLAAFGVVGIALGFGAQSLVRDIISGIFFLMEDAFRVGESIDTGRLRGTVEGMTLRSVRLRHQNGQMHTIPFGQVQAVTNFSRDWAVVKFNLHLEPGAELELVRKTVKRVGTELLEDPEIGAEFIQPLKLQGIVEMLQNALIVRCKFTASPSRPTYLQRQALRRLIEAFAVSNIRFAAPNVTLQLGTASV